MTMDFISILLQYLQWVTMYYKIYCIQLVYIKLIHTYVKIDSSVIITVCNIFKITELKLKRFCINEHFGA